MAGALLDREHEVADLVAAAAAASAGSGGTVVEGPPGIGKTTLLDVVTGRARRDGWSVLWRRGSSLERDFAFGIVQQLTREAPQGNPPPTTASTSEFQQFHDLYWWLVGLTDSGPTLVCVDDVQWADPASSRFLRFLPGWSRATAAGVGELSTCPPPAVRQCRSPR